jgi:hypothetical protein
MSGSDAENENFGRFDEVVITAGTEVAAGASIPDTQLQPLPLHSLNHSLRQERAFVGANPVGGEEDGEEEEECVPILPHHPIAMEEESGSPKKSAGLSPEGALDVL